MTKIKEKAIIPSLREKRRYIAYNVVSDETLNSESIKNAILSNCHYFLGELDYSKAGVKVLGSENNGVVRVSNKYLNKVRAAITLIDKVENKPVIIRTLGVSGILKKAKSRIQAG